MPFQTPHVIAPAGCSTVFQSLNQPAVRGSTLPLSLCSPSLVTSDELLYIRTVRRRKEGITVQIEEYFSPTRKAPWLQAQTFICYQGCFSSLSVLTRPELVEFTVKLNSFRGEFVVIIVSVCVRVCAQMSTGVCSVVLERELWVISHRPTRLLNHGSLQMEWGRRRDSALLSFRSSSTSTISRENSRRYSFFPSD